MVASVKAVAFGGTLGDSEFESEGEGTWVGTGDELGFGDVLIETVPELHAAINVSAPIQSHLCRIGPLDPPTTRLLG